MNYNVYWLYGFNNYFDRKVIFYNSLSDYLHAVDDYESKSDINFNPNDGVDTEIIINIGVNDSAMPNYLIVCDKTSNGIISRWFITDSIRTTGGQYKFILKRDVVVDHLKAITYSPIYVEKGYLKDDDPMILNDEGLTFNQIKKSETLLKGSKGAWIVGYMENSASANSVQGHTQSAPTSTTLSAIATDIGGNMTESDLISAINGNIEFNRGEFKIIFGCKTSNIDYKKINLVGNSALSSYTEYVTQELLWTHAIGYDAHGYDLTTIIGNYKTQFVSNASSLMTNLATARSGIKYFNATQYDKLLSHVGDVVLYGGRYYKVGLNSNGNNNINLQFASANTLFNNITLAVGWDTVYDDYIYYIEYQTTSIQIELTEILTDQPKASINASHNTLIDAPFSIFAIPYESVELYTQEDNIGYFNTISGNVAIDIATAIATALGTKLYDLQLLPYDPIDEGTYFEGDWWDLTLLTEGTDFDYIRDSQDKPIGAIFYPKTSNKQFSISANLTLKTSMKVDSQCRFYRLCSPNYNGVFEFNLAKNGGQVKYFNVDCTFKPFTPYIRIAPEFNLLYGTNYHDGRGLILGGDFSLPVMNDAWVNYQIQNKNYANIFSRDIQNLEFNQKQESFMEGLRAVTGTMTGAIGGGVAGFMATKNPYGAIAGAGLGLATSLVGGIADVTMGGQRRAEEKDYTIDRFNYSLANIKALPQGLGKNSSFTINNKIYPFLEFYDCTEQEEQALINKIKYDGMTVNRIDTLNNFIDDEPHFFKGQLIRFFNELEDSNYTLYDETHTARAIYEELLKGVYI